MFKYLYSIIWKVEGYDCETSFEDRKKSTTEILKKYPDKVPVLVSRKYGKNIKQIEKQRFMVTRYLGILNLKHILAKELKLENETLLHLESKNCILNDNINIEELYVKHKDTDGFLRIYYDY